MAMTARKAVHLKQRIETVNDLLEILERMDNLNKQYFAEGYGAGGDEDVTIDDLTAYSAEIGHMVQIVLATTVTQFSTISASATSGVRDELLKAATEV